MIPEYGSVIISWDYTKGKDHAVAVVGQKTWGQATKVINAFEGEEAIELVRKLCESKAMTSRVGEVEQKVVK